MSDERCQRCGQMGEDRRTLWMACFYAMEELGVPFGRCSIHGQYLEMIGEEPMKSFPDLIVPVYEKPKPGVESHDHRLYTLRVCKDCRGDWMKTIRDWFNSLPEHLVLDDPCANIPVRVDGTTRMMTRKQYDQYVAQKGGGE